MTQENIRGADMAVEKNPFVITFGKKPIEYISRPHQTEQILEMFMTDPITNQVYIICGPRGSGKTVLLSDIANTLEEDPEWLVIRCAPTSNILQVIAEGLRRSTRYGKMKVDANIHIPMIGSVSVSHPIPGHNEASDLYQIEDLLKKLGEKGKKILITIDEVTNTPQMQDFVSNLQLWMSRELPVFFLGTALYERIEELQNVANLTFLYRVPKINLAPLDMPSIARSYQKALDISEERSLQLAKLTQGYSFAFQALGYIYWNAKPVDDIERILPDYDVMLSNAAYSKMWQEMSPGDHALCVAISECSSNKVSDIRKRMNDPDSNRFNQRRIRLKNQGMINTSERGKITFTLPRFKEFVKMQMFFV
jgi:hypothetical protein